MDFDTTKPLQIGFIVPCPEKGKRKIELRYESLKEYCYKCGRLGHTRGCTGRANPKIVGSHRALSMTKS